MKSMRHFFTTEGRIYRKQYWLISLPCSLVMLSVDLYMKHLFLSNPNDSLNSDVPIFLSLSDSMIKEGPILLLLFTAFALAISLYLIAAAKRGAPKLPVSVKTRLGYNKDILDEWLPKLLEVEPAAVVVHARAGCHYNIRLLK